LLDITEREKMAEALLERELLFRKRFRDCKVLKLILNFIEI